MIHCLLWASYIANSQFLEFMQRKIMTLAHKPAHCESRSSLITSPLFVLQQLLLLTYRGNTDCLAYCQSMQCLTQSLYVLQYKWSSELLQR